MLLPLLLSFKAIYSLIPIILIVLLIAAAGGLTRGVDLFSFLGFGALMGFSSGMGRGKRTGLAGKKYAGGRGALKRIKGQGPIFGKKGVISIKNIRGLAAARSAGGVKAAVNATAVGIAGKKIEEDLKTRGGGALGTGAAMMAGTATPVETQIMRAIRQRMVQLEKQKAAIEEQGVKTEELEEAGKGQRLRVMKGAVYKAKLKNGKIVGYKMYWPYTAAGFVPFFGFVLHSIGRGYAAVRSVSPNYASVYGDEFDTVKKRSEELKNEGRVISNKIEKLDVELFKEQKRVQFGKEYFDQIWKEAIEEAKGKWHAKANELAGEEVFEENAPEGWQRAGYTAAMYGGTVGAVGGLKAAYRGYKRVRSGANYRSEQLRAPGRGGTQRGSKAWTTMHVRNVEAMQRSAQRFGQTKERLEKEMEELRAARATAQTQGEKRLIKAKLRAAQGEHEYISKVLSDIEKGTGQDIMTSFKLAMRGETVKGRKGAPKLAELKKRAKPPKD